MIAFSAESYTPSFPSQTVDILNGYVIFYNSFIIQWVYNSNGSQPAGVITKSFTRTYPINSSVFFCNVSIYEETTDRNRNIKIDWKYLSSSNITYQVTISANPYVGFYQRIFLIGKI